MSQKGIAPILIVLILAALVGGYFIFTNYSDLSRVKSRDNRTKLTTPPQPTTQLSPFPKDTLKKTLIDTKNSGKYVNEEYGYSVDFPKEWNLYTYYTKSTGNIVQLYHPKCSGKDFIPPEERIPCTNVTLPYYVGSTGWGYGNKKQIEETVTIKNNIKADKTTFYYDDYISISWIFNVDIPDNCEELGISSLVAFADINESFTPDSFQTIDSIIESLEFTALKDCP